jgi:hypothetical protein
MGVVANRSARCPCGSGMRYKECCGCLAGGWPTLRVTHSIQDQIVRLHALMNEALAAQIRQRFEEAEALYRAAIALSPHNFDALHMLGLVCLQLGRAEEACRLLMTTLAQHPTHYKPFFQNLRLCLATITSTRGISPKRDDSEPQGTAHLRFFRRNNLGPMRGHPPPVSIIVPCHNHERFVGEAIASVNRQSYTNIELIVIDDHSTDASAKAITQALVGCPFPYHFTRREIQGTYATLNEGIRLASGRYIGILNADDLYSPERIEYMVRMLQGSGARWGFSNVIYKNGEGGSILYGDDPRVDGMMQFHDVLYIGHAVSEAFPTTISTGNLFFERSLCQEVDRFDSLRYCDAWPLHLAAFLIAEPAYLDEPTYCYRSHAGKTSFKYEVRARREANALLSRWPRILASAQTIGNAPLATACGNGVREIDFRITANKANPRLGSDPEEARVVPIDAGAGASPGTPIVSNRNDRIIAVAVIGTEADIVEAFVRQNLRLVDEMLIVSHCPVDGTARILDKLAAEGLPIHIVSDDVPELRHVATLRELIGRAISERAADWVVPLDTDEFLDAADRSALGETLGKAGPTHLWLPWVNHVPTVFDNFGEANPLKRIQHRYACTIPSPHENPWVWKTILNAALIGPYLDRYDLALGAHRLVFRGTTEPCCQPIAIAADLRLRHFPVRSYAQLTTKISQGLLGTRLATGIEAGGEYHWGSIRADMEAGGEDIATLQGAVRHYLDPARLSAKQLADAAIIRDPMAYHSELRYVGCG